MKVNSIKLIILFVILVFKATGQETSIGKAKELKLSIGTFSTLYKNNRVTISPALSGYLADYYFENRYNYEADNSASINVGKRIFTKSKHIEVIPMVGLVFGSYKGITTELQTSLDYTKWFFSTDNQFSYEYTNSNKSLYFNWTVAAYKLTNAFRIGITTFLDKHMNQNIVFDKGITAAISLKECSIRFYVFNYEIEKRYYWLGVRYHIKVKLQRADSPL